jgi:hypothetical protein
MWGCGTECGDYEGYCSLECDAVWEDVVRLYGKEDCNRGNVWTVALRNICTTEDSSKRKKLKIVNGKNEGKKDRINKN